MAKSEIRLLPAGNRKEIVFNAPDPIAAAEFIVPSDGSRWSMDGTFEYMGTDYGKVTLSHWHTHPLPGFAARLVGPRAWLWGVIAFVLFAAAVSFSRSRARPSLSTEKEFGGKP